MKSSTCAHHSKQDRIDTLLRWYISARLVQCEGSLTCGRHVALLASSYRHVAGSMAPKA